MYLYKRFATQTLFFELSAVHSVTLYYNLFSFIIFTFSFWSFNFLKFCILLFVFLYTVLLYNVLEQGWVKLSFSMLLPFFPLNWEQKSLELHKLL